jgi:tetratricopeptide (TPR) repeat protein
VSINKYRFIEKAPFFIGALFLGVATIIGQKQSGAIRNINEISILLRFENACVSYVKYVCKTLWPESLAILYPFPLSIPLWQALSALIILLLISVLAVRSRHSHPYFTMGWFWFVLTLVPVIGVFQTGNQAMADRYSYIPGVGLFIMAAWGIPEYTRNMQLPKAVIPLSAGVVIIIFSVTSWLQASYWRDNISLYTRTLQHTEKNFMIHSNLGLALADRGELDTAILQYKESLRIKSYTPITHTNLGLALAKKGDTDSAIKEYQTALMINQDYWKAHNGLGMAFTEKGNLDEAIREYKIAQNLEPNRADPYHNLGIVYARKGDHDAAIHQYSESLRITPNDMDTHINLGVAFAMKNNFDAAIQEFQIVLQTNPNNDMARQNLNIAFMQKRMMNMQR